MKMWMVVAFDGGDRMTWYEPTKAAAEQRQREVIRDDHWDDVIVLEGDLTDMLRNSVPGSDR